MPIGLDLAEIHDLTAVACLFPRKDGSVITTEHYFLPADNIEEKSESDRVPYQQWADAGWLTLTPGETLDPSYVIKHIQELDKRYDVQSISYDDWQALTLNAELQKLGFEMIKFVKGARTYHPCCQELERLVLERRLKHAGNPVTTWCSSNVRVQMDVAGKMSPQKEYKKSRRRIDGIVAILMALDPIIRERVAEISEDEVPVLPAGADLRALMGI